LPDIPFPTVDIDRAASEINNALKDAAYVAVGLGVLGFQKAQVRRVELAKQLEGLPDSFSSQLDGYLRDARRRGRTAGTRFADDLGDLSRSMDEALDPLRAQLLELARAIEDLLAPARHQIDEQIDRFEQSLPDGPRSLMQSFRENTAAREQTWRSLIGLDDSTPSDGADLTNKDEADGAEPEPTATTEANDQANFTGLDANAASEANDEANSSGPESTAGDTL
jgi:hypothetical protein